MTSRLMHTSVDSRDAHAQSVWWSGVLGWSEDPKDPNLPGHEECMIFSPDGRQRVLFLEVPEGKAVKNRLHFDLTPTDCTRDEEVERLLERGAALHQDLRTPDGGWATLLDPEGNEFCVLRSESERPDPYAHLVV